jgi:NADH-quinone oxidoreductase subunit L
MLLAQEAANGLSSGWFLEHAWLIAVFPGIGFALIIAIGKRIKDMRVGSVTIPGGGSMIGIASMAASLVVAAGAAYQWIQRVDSSGTSQGALGAFGSSVGGALRGEAGGGYVAPVVKSYTWWRRSGMSFTIGSRIDGLSMIILLLVAFISTLVQIYSLEYLRGDRRYTHFFAAITLFAGGMLAMVLAENMVQVILGWEIMGLCSFLLIGHWWEDAENSKAALKAFLTVRVGDVGLMVGTAILFFSANSFAGKNGFGNGFSIEGINAWAMSGTASHQAILWGAVALFIACIGKSGQFPLHTWLPDAMAGPTPVSSLLHSSTMVVAGVYLVARIYPVFHTGLSINAAGQHFNLIAVIGGITILIAAGLAFVQTDIKKVLAYSTVSQLGYMMMGLGIGAWTPAVFHIFTHAFFKCCLFLCAGSVAHSGSHHSFEMKQNMGGLRKKMPITFACWMISTAALCGVPFFSGFFSKDEIIDNAHQAGYTVFWIIGLVGALMTTAYMTRATYLTFFGTPRGAAAGEHGDAHDPRDLDVDAAHAVVAHGVVGHGVVGHAVDGDGVDDHAHVPAMAMAMAMADHGRAAVGDHDVHGVAGAHAGHDAHEAHGPHESPLLITVPLVILAALAFGSGYLNAAAFHIEKFTKWVAPIGGEFFPKSGEGSGLLPEAVFTWAKAVPSILAVLIGAGLAAIICLAIFGEKASPLKGLTQRVAPLRWGHTFLRNKYYLDHLYEKVIIHGIAYPVAGAAYWTNQHVLDGIVNGAGKWARRAGLWVYKNIDQRVVDGTVNGSGAAARGLGGALRPVQSGKVNQYGALLFSAAAVAALVLVLVNT